MGFCVEFTSEVTGSCKAKVKKVQAQMAIDKVKGLTSGQASSKGSSVASGQPSLQSVGQASSLVSLSGDLKRGSVHSGPGEYISFVNPPPLLPPSSFSCFYSSSSGAGYKLSCCSVML